ncbi:hypothetical protein AA105894_0543 [Asaia spathodeae NBRC 105894]|nr:hypothetical protein AA105894_0543 [Asaia spathodeae NBRC 105894]
MVGMGIVEIEQAKSLSLVCDRIQQKLVTPVGADNAHRGCLPARQPFAKRVGPTDMVEMPVREKNGLDSHAIKNFQQLWRVAARIYNESLSGLRIFKHRAILAQRGHLYSAGTQNRLLLRGRG